MHSCCANLISSFNLAHPVLLKLKVLANKLLLKRQNLGQRNFILFENWCYSFLCVGYIILNNCLTKIIHSVPTPSGKFRQKSLNSNLMGRLTTSTKRWWVHTYHQMLLSYFSCLKYVSCIHINICIFWHVLFFKNWEKYWTIQYLLQIDGCRLSNKFRIAFLLHQILVFAIMQSR